MRVDFEITLRVVGYIDEPEEEDMDVLAEALVAYTFGDLKFPHCVGVTVMAEDVDYVSAIADDGRAGTWG